MFCCFWSSEWKSLPGLLHTPFRFLFHSSHTDWLARAHHTTRCRVIQSHRDASSPKRRFGRKSVFGGSVVRVHFLTLSLATPSNHDLVYFFNGGALYQDICVKQ